MTKGNKALFVFSMKPHRVAQLLFGKNPKSEDVKNVFKILLVDYIQLMKFHIENNQKKQVLRDAEKITLLNDLLDSI